VRVIKLLTTICGFVAIFVTMTLAGAFITRAVHTQLAERSISPGVARN
jgi:hypothetical protein